MAISTKDSTDHPLYPLALKLDGVACLVVGGGALALHRVRELLQCGARVHVVAEDWHPGFAALDAGGSSGGLRPESSSPPPPVRSGPAMKRSTRSFVPGDLEGISLVVAATDDAGVQRTVAVVARARGILHNVVDVPDLCNFYVPAVLRRGSLLVAVSTAGKSPLFSAAVRDFIGSELGPHVGAALDRLAEGRARVRRRFPGSFQARKEALKLLLTPAAVGDLIHGRIHRFEEHYKTWEASVLG